MVLKKDKQKQINILLVIQSQVLSKVQPLVENVADFNIIGHTTSGQQAYQLAQELSADIIIVGDYLDDMTGAEACFNLTEDLPLGVLMVGFPEPYDIQRMYHAVRARAYYYYPSPVSADEFQAKIHEGYKMYEYKRHEYRSNQK